MFGNIFQKKADLPMEGSVPGQPAGQVLQADTSQQVTSQNLQVSAQPAVADPAQLAVDPTAIPAQSEPDLQTPQSGEQAAQQDSESEKDALSHLDPRMTQLLTHAQEEARRLKQQYIEPEQLLIGALADEQLFKNLGEMSINAGQLLKDVQAAEQMGVYKGQPILSKTSQDIFSQAYRDAKMRGSNFVAPEDMFIVLFGTTYPTAKFLQDHGLKKEIMMDKFAKTPNLNYSKKTVLEKYGIDLTQEAREGKLDPVAGRDKEVDRMVHILSRRTKNNPIIIGETGVGKTAIVEGLAQQIANGTIPKDLQDKRIFQLDVASLIAGASHRGEFEERLRAVINEVLASDNKVVLFIDEIHSLMGAGEGEGMNAANLIKPYLARGHLQIIGATTTTEYRKNFEKDKAFERRFQPVTAEEPSDENAFEMLKVIRPKYEKFHGVTLPDDALKECIKLSKKYIGERYLPDKAIDLLDEACSEVKLQRDKGKRQDLAVKKADIEIVVSAWTGIPVTKLTEDESEKLLKLEERIHQRLIGQQEAVVAVSEAVRRGRIGLAAGSRPIASFVFLGPTGVGKTELAKTLAEILFGRDDSMARLDMSEYMEKHEVAKLIGAPPGYVGYEEGGQLTEAVRKKPYSIVLFDEIEKAHPDVFNLLLQLLEDGRLTDNKGNVISFKNTIVICTSNIGSALIQKQLGAQDKNVHKTPEEYDKAFKELQSMVREELIKFFRPELLNRFDEVIIFEPLRQEHMAGIARLGIAKTAGLLKEQGFNLQITEKAVAKLAIDGYDPVYGARPLRRIIQTAIENPIALAIISKKFAIGDTIVIDYNDNANEFFFSKGSMSQQAGQASGAQSLTKFKKVLQQLINPLYLATPENKEKFGKIHDSLKHASEEGQPLPAAILALTDITSDSDVQSIREQLKAESAGGNTLAKDILDIIDSESKFEPLRTLRDAALLLINPLMAENPEKREKFTAMNVKLTEASQKGDKSAVAILAVTEAFTYDQLQQLKDQLELAQKDKDAMALLVWDAAGWGQTQDTPVSESSSVALEVKEDMSQAKPAGAASVQSETSASAPVVTENQGATAVSDPSMNPASPAAEQAVQVPVAVPAQTMPANTAEAISTNVVSTTTPVDAPTTQSAMQIDQPQPEMSAAATPAATPGQEVASLTPSMDAATDVTASSPKVDLSIPPSVFGQTSPSSAAPVAADAALNPPANNTMSVASSETPIIPSAPVVDANNPAVDSVVSNNSTPASGLSSPSGTAMQSAYAYDYTASELVESEIE